MRMAALGILKTRVSGNLSKKMLMLLIQLIYATDSEFHIDAALKEMFHQHAAIRRKRFWQRPAV